MELMLELDGEAFRPREAKIALNVATESWSDAADAWLYGEQHLQPYWQLDAIVDDTSGEDGAPMPMFTFLLGRDTPIAALDAWPGTSFADPDNRRSEAWVGNDAPAIQQNVLTFGAWCGGDRIHLEWTGRYKIGRERREATFRLVGPVRFEGITMQVKEDVDAARLLAAALPYVDVTGLRQTWDDWRVHGPSSAMPEDRRRWHPVRWTRA